MTKKIPEAAHLTFLGEKTCTKSTKKGSFFTTPQVKTLVHGKTFTLLWWPGKVTVLTLLVFKSFLDRLNL